MRVELVCVHAVAERLEVELCECEERGCWSGWHGMREVLCKAEAQLYGGVGLRDGGARVWSCSARARGVFSCAILIGIMQTETIICIDFYKDCRICTVICLTCIKKMKFWI